MTLVSSTQDLRFKTSHNHCHKQIFFHFITVKKATFFSFTVTNVRAPEFQGAHSDHCMVVWMCPPQSQAFEWLFPIWWCCLGVRGLESSRKRLVTVERIWKLKYLHHFEYSQIWGWKIWPPAVTASMPSGCCNTSLPRLMNVSLWNTKSPKNPFFCMFPWSLCFITTI